MNFTKLNNNLILTVFVVLLSLQSYSQSNKYYGFIDGPVEISPNKSGEVLFDQMYNPGTGFMVSQHFSNQADYNNRCAAADDFVVPVGESWDIGSIGIMGSYFSGAPGGGDTLNVFFINDDNGMPGDTLVEYLEYTNFIQQQWVVNGYIQTYFEIILPTTYTLTAGTYWVSVQMVSDYTVTGQWGWLDHDFTSAIYGAQWHWINPKDGFELGFTEWTPASTVVGPWLTWELSFALFGAPHNNDIAVMSITSPDDYYYGPPAGNQNVSIVIKNEGLNPQTGFDLKYTFQGNEVIENIGSVTLGFNDTYEYTFSQTIDLSSPGSNSLSVENLLSGDENPNNDIKDLNIVVFDPTIYSMPSMQTSSYTTCSGTFTDAGGLEDSLVADDYGTLTLYPSTPGSKMRLDFLQFDVEWSDFWIYDGETINAPLIGYYEDTISPGQVTAGYLNTSGALTIDFEAQAWTPFTAPGWAANISCHNLPPDDFAVIDLEVSHPVITEYDHVTVYASIKNVGTDILDKNITFSANGVDFAVVPTGMVSQSDTVVVEATWVPSLEGDYTITASLPDDQGTDDNNSMSINRHVYSNVYFKEGFELMTFPPDGWSQTSNLWYRDDYAPAVGEGHARLDANNLLYDTLVTPRLTISAGDKIKFMAFNSVWWPGQMDLVWIDAVTGQGHLIQHLNLPSVTYQNFEIDVSAAAGNNYIGFAGTGMLSGGYGRVQLDEVEGVGLEKFFFNDDLKAYQLKGNNVPTANSPTFFNVNIGNVGSDVQTGSSYTVQLMQEPDIELASYPGQDIDPKETIEFTLDYTFSNAGEKHLYAVVDFPDDEDQNNNQSIPLVIFVQQEGTVQVPIGDGGTYQTWHPVFPGGGDEGGSFSQTLYLSDDVGDPITITGMMYYYRLEQNFPVYDFPLQLWYYETDATDVADSAFVPVTNMYKTFDGTIDLYPGDNGVYIPLDFPYPYTGQNLMVTAFKPNPSPYLGSWNWKTTLTNDVMVRYIQDLNDPIDPYDSLNINSFYPHMETEFANVRFFKIDLTGQYCIPQTIFGTMNGDYVDGVSFNQIENLGTGSTGGTAYHNYTAYTTPVERDRYYELTVQAASSGANGSVSAWIDYNGNKSFDDEGELVLHMDNPGPSQEVSTIVKIPADAELGITLMRVRNSSEPDLFTSCGAVDYGETEDYTVNILETQQTYNAVPEFSAVLDADGNVDMSWEIPENPGESLIEGYELNTFPPIGWEVKTSTTLDGTLSDPTDDTWMQYSDSLFYIYNGSFSAFCADTAPDFNWLITPQVQMYGNDDLTFMLNYSSDAMGYSKFYVLAEMDGAWNTVYELTDDIVLFNHYDSAVNINLSAYAGKTIRVAFVNENNDAYPVAIDDIVLKGMESSGKTVEGMIGYNIYRNEELLTQITDPSVLTASDLLTETESYEYCIRVAYDAGESEPLCETVFFLSPLTPPVNVRATADNNDVTVKWLAPNQGITRFSDDFESYNVNQQLACQNPDDWSTWTLNPCGTNDPYLSDEQAYSGTQSVVNEIESDLLYKTDALLTSGKYSVNFKMYVAQNYNAYFNVLQKHDLTSGSSWGFQAFFDQGGEGTIDAGGYSSAIFNFEYDSWMFIEVIVDLDNNWAEFLINDQSVHQWQWSTGITGGGLQNSLNAVDWYAWSSNAPAKFFIDDFQMIQIYDNPNDLTYNVYRNDDLVGNTSDTEYLDIDMQAGVYEYCVSAEYTEGESETKCDNISIITAPENFAASIQNENDVYCEWDVINSPNLQGYQVYRDDEPVSPLVTETNWTDMDLEGGSYTYYVTAVYNGEESVPSNESMVVILLIPQNLVANADGDGDIELNWEPVGNVLVGENIELSQHDGTPVNGYYQYFNNGYGVVYDLSAYPDATIEAIDFHHASWGNYGTWFYKVHIIDWNTFTTIAQFGPFTTTGDDIWEEGIDLGSIAPNSSLVAVLIEPMSLDPENAYPVVSVDESLQGFSIRAYIPDLTGWIYETADFLMNLWIFNPAEKKMVQAKKFKVDNSGNTDVRKPYSPFKGEITLNQKESGNGKDSKSLTGYNIYYAHNEDPFNYLDMATDTTYLHEGAGMIIGSHNYYVTANYEEGESNPSNIATEIISGIDEQKVAGITVYPNPMADVLTLSANTTISAIRIIDSRGILVVYNEGIEKNKIKIDVSNLPTGLYNIGVQVKSGWFNQKVIKK